MKNNPPNLRVISVRFFEKINRNLYTQESSRNINLDRTKRATHKRQSYLMRISLKNKYGEFLLTETFKSKNI